MPIGWAVTIVVLWLTVVALAVIVLGTLRQLAPVLERAVAAAAGLGSFDQGPAVGQELPRFTARDTVGEPADDQQLRGEPAILVFLSSGCGPCQQLAEEMRAAGVGALASQLIVVTSPEGSSSLELPAGLRVLAETANEVSSPMRVHGTPFAVAVDADGVVRATEVPNTLAQLDSLAAVVGMGRTGDRAVADGQAVR
jgi:methylamine dehydrogenase accessory protein MauD